MENSDDCQFTFSELKATLQEYIPDDKTIKYRLEEHYGNDVIISTKSTSQTLVCLRRSHYDILSEMYKQSAVAGNQEEQKLNALKVAADIIRSDIRSMRNYSEQYPASDKMFDNLDAYIPESLQIFLDELILKYKKTNSRSHKIKCTSIGHAIVCAVRPRSFLSPLHVGLAVTFHRKFGSKRIIDICSNLGFCSSYKEAQLYEASAALKTEIQINPGTFVQFVCDNADFNVDTLDGKGTFHYMGSIEIITPASGVKAQEPIERLKSVPTEAEINKIASIPLQIYENFNSSGLKKIQVKIEKSWRVIT